jgi:hypothetical protein
MVPCGIHREDPDNGYEWRHDMTEKAESQDWDATMDALEAYWLIQMTKCQDEYQGELQTIYGNSRTSSVEKSQ